MTTAIPGLEIRRPVLVDLAPAVRWRSVAFVVGGALLTAAAAQIRISTGISPVPITGQTFAVLLCGAGLGASRGAASQALYWTLGAIGLPFYTGGEGGWEAAIGSTGGYLAGFVVAAFVIGLLAERGQDRQLLTSIPAMLAGTAIIYAMGAGWLAHDLGVPVSSATERDALSLGVTPFLVGDAIKLVLAGSLCPLAWRLVR